MKKFAIIVAGGQGSRMNTSLPKQFLEIAGEPILFHTLRKFQDVQATIILVMNADYIEFWEALCRKYDFSVKHQLISGGTSRAQSVKNALPFIDDNALVAVHDAVRPFVSVNLINDLYNRAIDDKAIVPVIEVKDSLRKISDNKSEPVIRSEYKSVQTPQVFHASLLKSAFNVEGYEKFTDEASLVQANGQAIFLIDGEETNIKVTTPNDLIVAEVLIKFLNAKLK